MLFAASRVQTEKQKRLLFSGANNPLWIIRRNGTDFIELKGDKQPVGKHDLRRSFTSHELELHPGDTIYLFSDGYADQFGGPKGKKIKYSQLRQLLLSVQARAIGEQKEAMEKYLSEWMAEGACEQTDDICLIGIRS